MTDSGLLCPKCNGGTTEEIVKALECAIRNDCDCNCVFLLPNKVQDVLDLINRLKAENERLKAPTTDWLVRGISPEQLEQEKIQVWKAEAYKEFAERLKKALYSDSCRLVFDSDLDIFECAIDNLLKEMVGEDNAKEKE